jgi:hypothetical protein
MNKDLFSFPEIPAVQTVALLRSPPPNDISPDFARKIAERFGVKGDVEDVGARLIVRDKRSTLEIFTATGSVRWSARPGPGREAEAAPKLLDKQPATDRALARLREVGLEHKAASVHSVTDLEFSFRQANAREETTWAIARQVNLRFKIAGLPFFGPGAKIQVSLGDGGNPLETLRFWREVETVAEARTISPDHVIDILRRDESFAQLRPGESSVRFDRCQLGYYALPPREVQRVVVPVFAFTGTASTPALPRYDFMRYVPAVPWAEKGSGRPAELRAAASF